MYEEEVMQLTEALTSRTVRRNIEESGEIYDREYSIRTPEVRTFSTSIRPEDVIPPIDDWQPTSEEDKIWKKSLAFLITKLDSS